MSRNTRRMIERLDPFSLPQRGVDRLTWSPGALKVQDQEDASKVPRPPRPATQKKPRKPRRKDVG